ncbi:MAG: dTDP-4-dehydrorhamnose reductase [Candidatus Omnitrophota bacterium]
MVKPKTLFLTSGGLVGSNLLAEFKRQGFAVVSTAADTPEDEPAEFLVDVTDKGGLAAVFSAAKPQQVILAAAFTNVDLCESEKEKAYRINVEGCRNVAELCQRNSAKMVFFSSEYVFDGKNGPYSEEDIPHPINVYGQTKLEAEKIVAGLPEHLIIRTTVIYGKERMGKNFAFRLVNSLRQGILVKVPNDQISSPTYAPDLARAVGELVKKEKLGIYNVVGSEVISRYDFALRVAEVFGLNKDLLIPVTTAEFKPAAARPLKAGLKIDKVERDTGLKIPSIENSLKRFKAELNG